VLDLGYFEGPVSESRAFANVRLTCFQSSAFSLSNSAMRALSAVFSALWLPTKPQVA
jgi:hypothetical protein